MKFEARFRSLENVDPLTIPDVRNAVSVRNLRQTHDHLAEASTRFKSDWPEIQRLESSVDQAQARLDARVKAEAVQVKAEARMAYHAARQRELLLRQSFDEQKGQAQQLRRVAADYGQMQGELDNQRDMLQSLLRKQSDTVILKSGSPEVLIRTEGLGKGPGPLEKEPRRWLTL